MQSLFGSAANWYRGNLHTHTTVTDGRCTPENCMERYHASGYDFLAMTDHWKQSENGAYKGMTLLSGCEWDTTDPDAATVHIVGFGMTEAPAIERGCKAQDIVDGIRAAGGEAILAHPAWSLTQPTLLDHLTGFVGAEIYNTTSAFPMNNRPDSTGFFDQCAMRGDLLRAFANDDAHWYDSDVCVSSTWVKAADNSRESLLAALREGAFYASNGPRIFDICRDGDRIIVDCEPSAYVAFMSNSPWMDARIFCDTGHAEYTLKAHERWFRVEVTDKAGRKAWSSVYEK